MFDLKIKNAKVVDGTGLNSFLGELAVIDGTIVERGHNLGPAKECYDAEGLVLCPGFIDVHTHYDAQLTWDSNASPSLDLGVTTAIIGNCGFTIAPCKPSHRELNIKNLTKVEGMPYNTLKKGIDWNYESYHEYLSLLESKNLALNICSYIGHSALRIWAMGEEAMQREAREDEIIQMEKIVSDAMRSGAIGFSTSTFEGHNGTNGIPMPSRFASNEEISRLIKAMAIDGRGVFMLTKSNNTEIRDIIKLLGSVNRPTMVAALLDNPMKKDWAYNVLEDIEKAQNKGYEIWGQVSCRPLTMEFTMSEPYMLEGLSAWKDYMVQNTEEERKNILKKEEFRKAVLDEILDTTKNKLFVGNWEKIKLINTKRSCLLKHIGMNLLEIANYYNKEPFDWLLDNAIDGGFEDLFTAELLNSDNKQVQKLLKHKYSTIALSDAGAHSSLLCDAGYAIEFLSKWTRKLKVFTLEEAVYNLTAKQADICRIPKRGRLVPGHFADMILFDPNKISTSIAYRKNDLPSKSDRLIVDPIGIKEIWINGISKKQKPAGKLIREFLV
ncbi:MAG: amidohydrolase family protein [Pseudomonadota bacterium]|nr:amidohydrolase family protein [Pseudomonadota bacterium]